MFSYRHAFHAGNHADVLKHIVLMQLIHYLAQKETPYTFIDTHAGAGLYALDGGFAVKSGEAETGIVRLWQRDDLPPVVADYVNLVRQFNTSGKLRYYPGSPFCAEKLLRAEDRLRLFELHPTEIGVLLENFRKLEEHERAQGVRAARGKRVLIGKEDGFASLKALLPPPSRRALVLIDPPYEDKNDYKKVKDALRDALKRFPGGTYAVWYPLLQRVQSRQFVQGLQQLPEIEWLNVSLSIGAPSPDGFGLRASGMFIINPPWTLQTTLSPVMPYLSAALGVDAGAGFQLESGTSIKTAAARSPAPRPLGKR